MPPFLRCAIDIKALGIEGFFMCGMVNMPKYLSLLCVHTQYIWGLSNAQIYFMIRMNKGLLAGDCKGMKYFHIFICYLSSHTRSKLSKYGGLKKIYITLLIPSLSSSHSSRKYLSEIISFYSLGDVIKSSVFTIPQRYILIE